MIELLIALTIFVNAQRATPLVPDIDLSKRAEIRADYLCENKQWSHQGWLDSFQGMQYKVAGENLAKGFRTPESAGKAWMNSPTHKNNIIKPTYTHMGVAKGDCGIIVQLFKG